MNQKYFKIFLIFTLAYFATVSHAQICNTTGNFTNPFPLTDGNAVQAVACINETAYFSFNVAGSVTDINILFVEIRTIDQHPNINYYANGSSTASNFDQISQSSTMVENVVEGLIYAYNVVNGTYIIAVTNNGESFLNFRIFVYLSDEVKKLTYQDGLLTTPLLAMNKWLYFEFYVDTIATIPNTMFVLAITPLNATVQNTFVSNYLKGTSFPTLAIITSYDKFVINGFTSYYLINPTNFLTPVPGQGSEITFHLGIRNSGPDAFFNVTTYTVVESQLTSSNSNTVNLQPNRFQFFSVDVNTVNRNNWVFYSLTSNGLNDSIANFNYAFNDYPLFTSSQWSKTNASQVLPDGRFLHEYVILPTLFPSTSLTVKVALLNGGSVPLNASVTSYFVTLTEMNLDQKQLTVIPNQWYYYYFTINIVGRLFVLQSRAADDSEYFIPEIRYGDFPIAGENTNMWSQVDNSTLFDNKKTVTTYIYTSVQLPQIYYIRLRSTDTSVQSKTVFVKTYVSDEKSIQPYHNRFFGEFIAASDMNFYTFLNSSSTTLVVVELISFNGNVTVYFQDNGRFPTLSDYKPWTNIDYVYNNTQNNDHDFVFLADPFASYRQQIRLAVANNMANLNTRYNLFVHYFDSKLHNLPLNTIIKKTISTGDWHYFLVNLPGDSPSLYLRIDGEFSDQVDVYLRKDFPPTSLSGTYMSAYSIDYENTPATGVERAYVVYQNITQGTYYLGINNAAQYTARYTLVLAKNSTFPDTPVAPSVVPNPSKDYSGIIIGVASGCGVAIVLGGLWFVVNRRKRATSDKYHLLDNSKL